MKSLKELLEFEAKLPTVITCKKCGYKEIKWQCSFDKNLNYICDKCEQK